MTVTYAGRQYEIPDMWLVGACAHARDFPILGRKSALRRAIMHWIEQDQLREQFLQENPEFRPRDQKS